MQTIHKKKLKKIFYRIKLDKAQIRKLDKAQIRKLDKAQIHKVVKSEHTLWIMLMAHFCLI